MSIGPESEFLLNKSWISSKNFLLPINRNRVCILYFSNNKSSMQTSNSINLTRVLRNTAIFRFSYAANDFIN